MTDTDNKLTRRQLLGHGLRGACVLGLGAGAATLLARSAQGGDHVWQIDPAKCLNCQKKTMDRPVCTRCATSCVLTPSATKCVHAFPLCGYCDLCTGYLDPKYTAINTAAENQLCPTGAIKRTHVEDDFYEYTIDEPLCIGCGKCVKGCVSFGNGSLLLQVRHDRCVNCSDCSIAAACPTGAIVRVPAGRPYIFRDNKDSNS